eukprot:gene6746-9241_t
MKIRAITFGLSLDANDFTTINIKYDSANIADCPLEKKFNKANEILNSLTMGLNKMGFDVQTIRISLNPIDEWLSDPFNDLLSLNIIQQIVSQLEKISIKFCSISFSIISNYIHLIPSILALSNIFSASIQFDGSVSDSSGILVSPNFTDCQKAADTSLQIFEKLGDLGNFRFCTSFNCKPGIPFFPASYHQGNIPSVSIGLESGDLIFLAFHAAETIQIGRNNLEDIMRQALLPIQSTVEAICIQNEVLYGGIDASINPGLTTVDSVGAGIEDLLCPKGSLFGQWSTLSVVSAITSAIKSLSKPSSMPFDINDVQSNLPIIKLTGYSGLMLPVMEDLILAERAASNPPFYSLRDLLTFSSVCGVGLDTVPVPGDITIDQLASVFMEVGTMAFRLQKPLSCRLLPMRDKCCGDTTDIVSPYLCNTKVFSLK